VTPKASRRGGARQAVEHTTIDAYLEQREDTARYRKVFMPLEEATAPIYLAITADAVVLEIQDQERGLHDHLMPPE
jgi:hypothetical protein